MYALNEAPRSRERRAVLCPSCLSESPLHRAEASPDERKRQLIVRWLVRRQRASVTRAKAAIGGIL